MNDYTIKMNVTLNKSDTSDLEDKTAKAIKDGLSKGAEKGFNEVVKQLKNLAKGGLRDVLLTLFSQIKSFISDSISELSNMLNMSQLSSAYSRDLAFTYGFSPSQAYGWTKALEAVGLTSEQDLFYANTQELKQFREAFEKYSNYYNKLYDSGFFEKLQDYQFEMQDFKNEMQMQIVEFFIDNKDTIKQGLQAIMTIADWVVKAFSWWMGNKSSSDAVATSSDIVNQYINQNKSSSAQVSVNNTFNNVDSSTSNAITSQLSNEYRAIIKAIGG